MHRHIVHLHHASKRPPATIKIPRLTLETAQKIAQAALIECRKGANPVSISIVDRGGHPVAILRDTLAPDVTLELKRQKAIPP